MPLGPDTWLCTSFGLYTAAEEFLRWQNEALEGLPGVKSIVDDILLFGVRQMDEEAIKDHNHKVSTLT